jgi:hypothetical protein
LLFFRARTQLPARSADNTRMSERREWWVGQCARLSSLSYAAGYQAQAEEHYEALVTALLSERARVIWAAAEPAQLQGAEQPCVSD